MITRLGNANAEGVFKDFIWPEGLNDFSKYNIIYGWNGTGKTSFSRLFSCVENNGGVSCVFDSLDGKIVSTEKDVSKCCYDIKVFNSDFVKKFVYKSSGTLNPIYYFGKDSVAQIKELERIDNIIEGLDNDYEKCGTLKSECENEKERLARESASRVRRKISDVDGRYKNYNIKLSRERLAQFYSSKSAPRRLYESELRHVLDGMNDSYKNRLETIHYNSLKQNVLAEEIITLMKESAVSNIVNTLTSDGEVSSWIESGVALHARRSVSRCLYCGQLMPKSRIAELEGVFSNSFAGLKNKVVSALARIENMKRDLDFDLVDKNSLYSQLASKYDEFFVSIYRCKRAVAEFLDEIIDILNQKKNTLFAPLDRSLKVSDVDVFDSLLLALSSYNEIIAAHNVISDKFKENIKELKLAYEDHCLAEVWDDYVKNCENYKFYEEFYDAVLFSRKNMKLLRSSIESEMIDTSAALIDINNDLENYLGHNDIQFELVGRNGYRLIREGRHAKMLSEGELMAVSFVFFLRSLSDKDVKREKTIVVIDDPVSSMDSSALYGAFGYMKSSVDKVHQLFIMTHNFPFLNEIKKWFHGLEDDDTFGYYMMMCESIDGLRRVKIVEMDPLIKCYNTDYHYLYKLVKDAADSDLGELSRFYFMPNVARRLLEAFLEFKFPNAKNLTQRIHLMKGNEQEKIRILRFVHKFSHNDSIPLDIGHDPVQLGEAPLVLRTIRKLMKKTDGSHFSGMEKIIASS